MSKKSKTFLDSLDLNVGPRYVFFESLLGSPGPQPTWYYNNISNIGLSLLSSIEGALKQPTFNNENEQQLNKIKQYIDFIGEVAENEKGNEINFIKQMNEYLKKDEELQKNFNKFLEGIENGSGFDYLQLMNLINKIMIERDKLRKKREEVYANNMNITSKNFETLNEDLQQEAISLFELGDFDELNKFINKHLLKPVKLNEEETLKYTSPINNLIANKINSVMINLGKNEAIRNLIIQQITNNGWDQEELYSYIYGMTVEYITALDYDNLISKNGSQLADEIVNNFDFLLSKVNKQIADNAEDIFTKKNKEIEKTLEEVAFTTNKALADIFDNIEQSKQTLILQQYLTNEEINKLKHFHSTLSSVKYRENFSKILGKAIRRRFKELGFSPTTLDKNKIKEEVRNFMKQNTTFFINYHYKNDFKKHFNIKTTGSSVAEYIATHLESIGKAIVFGNKTKFKTDISITFSFNPFENSDFLTPDSSKQLDNFMNNFFSEFLEKYKEENLKKFNASEQTDVISAVTAYKNEMKELHNLIEKIAKKDKLNEQEKQKLLDNLSNFLLNSISVKDYNYYTDQLGFHGGSLGGGNTPENVINNIEAMYELGGISPIDKDLLLFAAINCGPDGFAKGLKEDLANYLLGGAAMIMFDDGFTAANAFLDKVRQEFNFAIPSLHLYKLNGTYIPASYIYSNIHKNLQQVYGLLSTETQLSNIQHKNKVIINNNITEETHKPSYEKMSSASARWNTVASAALSEVQITFVFMAGLLDIFEQIPKAFNNV